MMASPKQQHPVSIFVAAAAFLPFIILGTNVSVSSPQPQYQFAGILEFLHLSTLFKTVQENNKIPRFLGGDNSNDRAPLDQLHSLSTESKKSLKDVIDKKPTDLNEINKGVEEETGINFFKFFKWIGKIFRWIFNLLLQMISEISKK